MALNLSWLFYIGSRQCLPGQVVHIITELQNIISFSKYDCKYLNVLLLTTFLHISAESKTIPYQKLKVIKLALLQLLWLLSFVGSILLYEIKKESPININSLVYMLITINVNARSRAQRKYQAGKCQAKLHKQHQRTL